MTYEQPTKRAKAIHDGMMRLRGLYQWRKAFPSARMINHTDEALITDIQSHLKKYSGVSEVSDLLTRALVELKR